MRIARLSEQGMGSYGIVLTTYPEENLWQIAYACLSEIRVSATDITSKSDRID